MALGFLGRDADHPHRRENCGAPVGISAPPRIGVRSRAAYEAERLMQWATGRPSVTPVKASTISPVPAARRPDAAAGVAAGGRLKDGGAGDAAAPAKASFFRDAAPCGSRRCGGSVERGSGRAGDGRARRPTRGPGPSPCCASCACRPARARRPRRASCPGTGPRGGSGEIYAPEALHQWGTTRPGIFIGGRSRATTSAAPDGATLLGVAEVPLSKGVDDAAAFAPEWMGPPPIRQERHCRNADGKVWGKRCLLEPAPPTPALRSRGAARVEALEGELEVPPFEGRRRRPSRSPTRATTSSAWASCRGCEARWVTASSRRIAAGLRAPGGAVPRLGRVVAARGLARGLRRA